MAALDGKVVIVTGASSGIGAATSLACAHEGARVALAARRQIRLEAIGEKVQQAGGEALIVSTDVTNRSAIKELLNRVMERWGRIDVLVNNAARGLVAPFEETSAEELCDLFSTNVVSVLMMTQAVLPIMRRQQRGHIINVSSIAGRHGTPFRAAYSATKFALGGLTETLRQELKGTGIRVSLVYPVTTQTEFHEVEMRKIDIPHSGPIQSAETAARAIVQCIKRPRAEVYTHHLGFPLALLTVLAPQLVDALASAARHPQTIKAASNVVPTKDT